MNLNVKTLTIDCDEATTISAPLNPVNTTQVFTKGSTYILEANTYANSWTNTVATFTNTDSFALYIGRQYESNASPVITITDASKFNNTSDWSISNVYTGNISVNVNVSSTALTTDIGNSSSQSYIMQLVLTNNVGGKVILSESQAFINNALE